MSSTKDRVHSADLILPASAERVDRELVERAAREIKEILLRTLNRGVDEIGQYLLKEFYEDDPEVYFAKSPTKHASLSKLAERCESMGLPVKRSFLGNALRIAAVGRQLPRTSSFHKLPHSHRVELVRIRKPERMEALASKVASKSLTVEKTKALVQKEAAKIKSPVGRKPIPHVIRAINAARRLLVDADSGELAFGKTDVDALKPEQLEQARADHRTLERYVQELGRVLR